METINTVMKCHKCGHTHVLSGSYVIPGGRSAFEDALEIVKARLAQATEEIIRKGQTAASVSLSCYHLCKGGEKTFKFNAAGDGNAYNSTMLESAIAAVPDIITEKTLLIASLRAQLAELEKA